VALKVRVIPSKPLIKGAPLPNVVYNAELYDDQDPRERTVWSCTHDHPSEGLARKCGKEQLAERTKTLGMGNPLRRAVARLAEFARVRILYLRLRLRTPTFRLLGRRYPIQVSWYNRTWRNERQVELPPILEVVRRTDPGEILEVGNVLAHYGQAGHIVVDKYEDATGTLRVDVVDYHPGRSFRLIVAISTLEHVGWDEPEKDPAKFDLALDHLVRLLAPGGQLWATIPRAHNPGADAFLDHPREGFSVSFLVRRSPRPGDWAEVASATAAANPYRPEIPSAQAIGVVRYEMRAPEEPGLGSGSQQAQQQAVARNGLEPDG
jgi:hypothetical protein